MSELKTVLDIECLLHNGREIWLNLELGRDTETQDDDKLVFVRRPQPGIEEESTIMRSDIAYLRRVTRPAFDEPNQYRTLGKSPTLAGSVGRVD